MAKWLYEDKGVNCKECGKCLSRPRKRKYPNDMEIRITCEECANGKFSSDQFSIHHRGNNEWIIRNAAYSTWMGKDEWVHESSSHHALCDSKVETFTWDEAVDFIKRHFGCNLEL